MEVSVSALGSSLAELHGESLTSKSEAFHSAGIVLEKNASLALYQVVHGDVLVMALRKASKSKGMLMSV